MYGGYVFVYNTSISLLSLHSCNRLVTCCVSVDKGLQESFHLPYINAARCLPFWWQVATKVALLLQPFISYESVGYGLVAGV